MSCRKFSAPRHGSLAYCPKHRASSVKQSLRASPADDPTTKPHITGFFAYKVGMSHVIRSTDIDKSSDKLKKIISRDIFDAVSFLEAPPVVIFGIIGYETTISGLKRKAQLFSEHISEGVVRRLNRNYYNNKKTDVLSKFKAVYEDKSKYNKVIEMLKECDTIRVMIHSQCEKIKTLKTKKSHIMEVHVNGGKNVEEKLEWALEMMEKEVKVTDVFNEFENIDVIGVTKGKGVQGCPKRFGTRVLPRKTNKGIRKVACIGAWHPSRVMWTVARAGQLGFHRRTEINKLVYKIGNGNEPFKTDYDLTEKTVNPMGGFLHYGAIKNDYIMVKGSVCGPRKRVVTLRKTLHTKPNTIKADEINVKFLDTSSKFGSGRFQTTEEKKAFYGITKKKVTEIVEQK